MAKQESTLAYTVHYKGRKYRAGLTADEVGDVAGEFGDHVWEDGNAPNKTKAGVDGGSQLGSPPVPTRSALPTPETTTVDDDAASTPKRTGGNGTRRS